MKKQDKKLICIVLCLTTLILTGCSVRDMNIFSSKEDVVEEDIENTFELSEYMLPETDGVYDITSVIPEVEGMVLDKCGFRSDSEILLIYKTDREENFGSGEDYDEYRVKSFNLVTGELRDMPCDFQVSTDEYNNSRWLSVVSMNPLMMYDISEGIIYTPEKKLSKDDAEDADVQRPDDAMIYLDGEDIQDVVYIDDAIYVVRYAGIIERVNDDGTYDIVYSAPDTVGQVFMEKGESDDIIKLSTMTYDGESIYVEVDTRTWEDRIYTQDYYDYYIAGVEGHVMYGTTYADMGDADGPDIDMPEEYEVNVDNTIPNIVVIDTLNSTVKSIKLPDEYSKNTYPDMYSDALCGNMLLFETIEYNSGARKIFLWDTGATKSEAISLNEKSIYTMEEMDYDELSDKASEIGDKYGVTIKFGDNIKTEISDYTFEVYDKRGYIEKALDLIDGTLECYPDGFFDDLEKDLRRDTIIYLTGKHIPKDATVSISDSTGLTSDEDGLFMLFLNIEDGILTRDTIVHEITHIIDHKLWYDGALDDDEWCTYNPEGFEYYYEYVNDEGEDYAVVDDSDYTSYYDNAWDEDYQDTYFIDSYSKTWPTEDRARLMEYLIGDMTYYNDVFHSVHLQNKLDYYFKIIRDDLGRDDWPAETVWEERLGEYRASR